MKLWWCMECESEVKLGKHGQCGTCGSEAVDLLPAEDEVSGSVSETTEKTEQPRFVPNLNWAL
jgi:hypothetical protein